MNEEQTKTSYFVTDLRNTLLAGVMVIIPILLSFWVVWKIYAILTGWGSIFIGKIPFLNSGALSPFWLEQLCRLFSLVVIFVTLILVGLLARVTIGRKLITWMQDLLLKIPAVSFVYSTCKQIGDALWKPKGSSMFQKTALIQYPRPGLWTICFITNDNLDSGNLIVEKLGADQDLISVYVPTTPNPTSGFLLYVPRKECIMLDNLSAPEAMKLVVSCGTINPAEAGKLAEQAGNAEK